MDERSNIMARRGSIPRRIAIGAIPELARPMGLFGTLRQAEVGGSGCYGALVTFTVAQSG